MAAKLAVVAESRFDGKIAFAPGRNHVLGGVAVFLVIFAMTE